MPEKILINLLSEQRLPNYIAIMHELPDRVIALTTPDFSGQTSVFEELTATPHEPVAFDAFDFAEDLNRVRVLIESLPQETEIIFNFTGGTKIMAVASVLGALAEASDRGIRLLYVDTARSRAEIIRLGPGRKISTPESELLTLNLPVKAFLGLHGERSEISVRADEEQLVLRHAVAKTLLKPEFDGFFAKQRELHLNEKTLKLSGQFSFSSKGRGGGKGAGSGSLSWDGDGTVLKNKDGREWRVEGSDAVAFFAGGWLEEYCYLRLKESGRFNEVHMNVKIELSPATREKMRRQDALKNEIDLIVAKGLRAVLVECKAGMVKQDHIYKLAVLRDHLLGSFGAAALVCRNPLPPDILEKANDLNIAVIVGNAIMEVHRRIEKLLEKQI